MKNKKGFTLIELLAVIVILGLLMAIAIPSVTKYITESRKKTVTSSINNYVGALINDVNDMQYTFTETDVIYAVPIECIALERGGTDPFGEWHQASTKYWAYVLIQYNDNTSSYIYGFTFKDSAGYGLYPTSTSKLNEKGSQIQTGLSLTRPISGKVTNIASVDKWVGFKVTENTNLTVLEAETENVEGNKISTCTLAQKGTNYAEIEKQSSQPIKLINGKASLSRDINLTDKPVYKYNDNNVPVTINGNGHTVNQTVTTSDSLSWVDGRYPNMAYIFTSTNGSKVTVNDLTITGQAQSVMLGHYVNATYNNFNTELNNVNVVGLEVFSFSSGIAPGVVVYGKATLNNCNVYGTRMSSMDTDGYTVYDLAVTNYSTTIVNRSKIGTVYTWAHSKLTFNGSEVDRIETRITKSKGDLIIGSGTHVGTIKAISGSNIKITIKSGAVVDTLDLSSITNMSSCVITIEPGATVYNTINP